MYLVVHCWLYIMEYGRHVFLSLIFTASNVHFSLFLGQIINVYDQKYESAAAFWPHVHRRVIIGLVIAQLLLMGLFSTLGVASSTFVLIAQPILTIWFHIYCKGRFESAFKKFSLQVSEDLGIHVHIIDIWYNVFFMG